MKKTQVCHKKYIERPIVSDFLPGIGSDSKSVRISDEMPHPSLANTTLKSWRVEFCVWTSNRHRSITIQD